MVATVRLFVHTRIPGSTAIATPRTWPLPWTFHPSRNACRTSGRRAAVPQPPSTLPNLASYSGLARAARKLCTSAGSAVRNRCSLNGRLGQSSKKRHCSPPVEAVQASCLLIMLAASRCPSPGRGEQLPPDTVSHASAAQRYSAPSGDANDTHYQFRHTTSFCNGLHPESVFADLARQAGLMNAGSA